MPTQMDIETLLQEDDGLTKLEADMGDRMLLKVEGLEGFLKTELVGMEAGRYLLVNTPKGGPTVRAKFYEGNVVLVRYLHQGAIFAFQSNVLGSIDKPVKLVFLSYPAIVSRQELRHEQRMECYLNAAIDLDGTVHNGVLLDISPSGCRFAAKYRGPRIPSPVGKNIKLAIKLGAADKAQAISSIIRSSDQSNSMLILGIQFGDMDEDSQFRLNSLVGMLSEFAAAKRNAGYLGGGA